MSKDAEFPPQPFWAADCGEKWIECESKEAAFDESAQHLRRPHAMKLRRMKLSELIARCASNLGVDGHSLAEELSEQTDPVIQYCYNYEANPLGEHLEDELQELGEIAVRAMMAEADKRELVVDGCVLLADKWGVAQPLAP